MHQSPEFSEGGRRRAVKREKHWQVIGAAAQEVRKVQTRLATPVFHQVSFAEPPHPSVPCSARYYVMAGEPICAPPIAGNPRSRVIQRVLSACVLVCRVQSCQLVSSRNTGRVVSDYGRASAPGTAADVDPAPAMVRGQGSGCVTDPSRRLECLGVRRRRRDLLRARPPVQRRHALPGARDAP